ncbi:MAG TPA: TonB-dependent receptor [Steroidobacteraceae bacterium]|nr:TonB-dependent receptor [Steroidobacteraceae bacterium]
MPLLAWGLGAGPARADSAATTAATATVAAAATTAAAATATATTAGAAATTVAAATATTAATTAGTDAAAPQEVVVTARIRSERVEDVPIPVTAVSGDTLDALDDVTLTDWAKLTPNLLVNAPNARQTSIAIRGIGKNTANDALEPSVGVVVDGVAMAYIAQDWGDFPDLDHVEVERGPQGTLLGKNTTLGVVQVVSKAPSFDDSYSATVGTGERNDLDGKFTATGGLVDGLLAYRASFYAERRDGPFHDVAPDATDNTFQGRNRFGAKLQFLLTLTDDLSARIILDRQVSSELLFWGEAPLIGDPEDFPDGVSRTLAAGAFSGATYTSRLQRPYFDGYVPYVGDGDTVDNNGARPTTSQSGGLSAQVDWKLPAFTLTSISAVRNSLFDAHNDADWTHFDIGGNGAIITQTQVSQELHLTSSIGQLMDYTTGVYFLNSHVNSCDRNIYGADAGAFYASNAQYAALADPVGQDLLVDSLKGLFYYTCTAPTTKSEAAFGQVNWHLSDAATLTTGVRVTHENKDNFYDKFVVDPSGLAAGVAAGDFAGASAAQLAAAEGILKAQANDLGSVVGDPISATSYAWLFNPSYKLGEHVLLYASASHGEKSGAVLFNTSTLEPQNVAPEKTLDFELGVKAELLERRLTVNVNLYDTEVTDYQQNITVADPTQASGFRTYLGNAPKVRLSGLEFDTEYTLNEYFGIVWNGAFNRAIYADFADAPCPADIAAEVNAQGVVVGPLQCNLTGRQLPYAPRFTTNVGPDFHLPLGGRYVLHAYVNEAFRSRANMSAGLSQYGWQGSYSIVDTGIGVATTDGRWEWDFIGSNVLDKWYYQDITTYTNQAAIEAYPGEQRYLGLQVHLNFR